jgi:hypothetical protein
VYPCTYDHDAQKCQLGAEPEVCCDNFCRWMDRRGSVKDDVLNAGSHGVGPWCGERRTQATCEKAVWIGGKDEPYPCVWAADQGRCRLSLNEGKVCPCENLPFIHALDADGFRTGAGLSPTTAAESSGALSQGQAPEDELDEVTIAAEPSGALSQDQAPGDGPSYALSAVLITLVFGLLAIAMALVAILGCAARKWSPGVAPRLTRRLGAAERSMVCEAA